MSRREGVNHWLLCYPRAWRERYGQEMQELILATNGTGPLPWRARADLLRAGIRERLLSLGFGGAGVPPARRARAGVLLVLCAWALMLVGGSITQRFSENWREVTPAIDQALPRDAYYSLIVAAVLAGLCVLAGIALVLPRFFALLGDRGFSDLRRPIGRALEATALAALATLAVYVWSRQLSPAQRNGHDLAYGIGFLIWGVAGVACLTAWTAVAVKAGGRIELGERLLRVLSALAVGAAIFMTASTISAALWWGSLARSAPWALSDTSIGSPAAPLTVPLLTAGLLMALASCIAIGGAAYAVWAVPGLSGRD